MPARRCPRCKLINPEKTAVCDCGWSFVTDTMTESRNASSHREEVAHRERRSQGTSQLAIGGVLLVVGIVITVATYGNASTSGGTYIIAYGPIVAGIIAMIRGLAKMGR